MSVSEIPALNRSERRKQHTRQQLLEAAANLLNEVGYSRLTVKSITDRADVGYGTFYLHFADVDEIVWAVIHTLAEEMTTLTEQKIAGLPFPLREYHSRIYIFEYAAQTRQGIVELFGSSGSAKLLQRYQDYLAAKHEENLRLGRYSSGLELPPMFLAQMITGALVRLLIWWSETPNDYTPRQMADMLYEAIYRQPAPR
ncbi:MAG: TetR/AcrR family transcriptional regulator [Chloroflexi bacterium]|nr:TetR/AcrR family transcriptional regulator [Chloroflexota bacterium]MCC6893056.1 TetR/AcrR family transcriptional regulator [Anaerolineae bacterium]